MIASDMSWIALNQLGEGVVSPFEDVQTRTIEGRIRAISYGLSSAGYDLRLCPHEILVPKPGVLLNPKHANNREHYDAVMSTLDRETGERYWDIPAGGSALALSVETITIPRECLGLCVGKSTYARCGLIVNTTPLEPEWCGRLVIELHNVQAHNPIRIYGNEGIAQLILFKIDGPIFTSYADRGGKYQNQAEITPARA